VGNSQELSDGSKIIAERGRDYGGAWVLTGQVLALIQARVGQPQFDMNFIEMYANLFHPWYMILNKLMRIVWSPDKLDNWIDIAGYAQLVIDYLKGDE